MPRLSSSLAPVALLAALGLMPSAAGCRGPSLPAEASTPIRIGAVLPLSGEGLEGDGPFYRDAMLLAVREINAAGGLLGGRRVELLVGDSEDNPATAAREAQRLIDEGAVVILGDASSSGSLRIYEEVTSMARVPQISCTSTSTDLTNANADLPAEDRFFYRTAPPDQLQAEVVLEAAMVEGSCTRTALLYQDDSYGAALGDLVEQQFSTAGTALVASVPFVPGAASFDAPIASVRAATPDCVVLLTYPPDAGDILRAWDIAVPAMPVTWIGTDALYTSSFIREAGSAAIIDGFLGTAPFTTPPIPDYNAFADRLEAATGSAPEQFQSNCYDAAALALLAIDIAGVTDGDAIRDALNSVSDAGAVSRIGAVGLAQGLSRIREGRTVNYEGASGPVDFDEFGDVVSDYVIWRFDATTMDFVQGRTLRPARSL